MPFNGTGTAEASAILGADQARAGRRREDLAYRPEPILLTTRQKQTVSAELRQLLREREKLRVTFVNAQAAGDSGEGDALSNLNGLNDDVLMFEPQSIADLAIIVSMARHQIATSEVHEDFLEHLLTSVERLVLEAGHE